MQCAVLSDDQLDKIDRHLQDPYRTMVAIMRYTMCRSCEVRRLRVENCYGSHGNPKDNIVFPKEIRKGKRNDLILPVSPKLHAYLKLYNAPENGLMFPSAKFLFNPVSYESLRLEFQKAAFKAGIKGEKICTHSLRRSGLTKLNNQGVNLRLIQSLAGHQNLNMTQSYLEVTEQQQQAALNTI